jgi:hypothetical protein
LFSEQFKEDYEGGKFVTAQNTVLNLLNLIDENTFESGSSIRYAPYSLNNSI